MKETEKLAGQDRERLKSLKTEQRRAILQKRDELPPDKREKNSKAICERLSGLEICRKAQTIFLFRSFGSEADLSPFAEQMERENKILLYPYCADRETMLALRPGVHWETDRFGIRVPVRENAVETDPASIDLVLCPCAGFDLSGRRLGMGGGYYDRFLLKCPQAFRLLVAFEAQCLDEVCTGPFDLPVDGIVTESRLLLFDREK